MNPVGYLHNTPQGLVGDAGIGYNYILAANGLFLRAESSQLKATILLAEATVRGLAPLEAGTELPYGKIPMERWEWILEYFRDVLPLEKLLTIANILNWPAQPSVYMVNSPVQVATTNSIRYRPLEGQLLEVHSHGAMRAFFSGTDDADEQGFRIYGCVGTHGGRQEWKLRVGIYGQFAPLSLEDVFE